MGVCASLILVKDTPGSRILPGYVCFNALHRYTCGLQARSCSDSRLKCMPIRLQHPWQHPGVTAAVSLSIAVSGAYNTTYNVSVPTIRLVLINSSLALLRGNSWQTRLASHPVRTESLISVASLQQRTRAVRDISSSKVGHSHRLHPAHRRGEVE